ncbi:MAG: 50S ribosomal protein L9 [Bacteroidota bacterium]
MEVILKRDFKGLGYKNDLVAVRPGYGRNYLIPQGLAMVASAANKKVALENARQTAHKVAKRKQDALAIAAQLDQLTVVVAAKAGEQGKIFGSVTASKLAEALQEQGIWIDRKDIHFETTAKTLGVHQAMITLHKEVVHPFSFQVVAA